MVVPLRALADRRGRETRRPRGDHAGAVPALLRRAVRHHQAWRGRGAAVHAVRPRRRAPARGRLPARAAADHGGQGRRHRGTSGHRASSWPTPRSMCELQGFPGQHSTPTPPARVDGAVPVHVGHDARSAGGGAAHAPRRWWWSASRRCTARGCQAGGPVFLPVVAGLGAWAVARHAGAAGAWAWTTGTMSGRFDPERLLKALQDHRITNLSAAATHYRLMRNTGAGGARIRSGWTR